MFNKITILFLLITVYSVKCIGQKQSTIDSLLNKLSDTKTDTIKVNILAGLAYEYLANDVNKAIDYGNKSLNLAKQTSYSYGIALSLRNLSYAYYIKSDYTNALNYSFQSIKEAQKINNNILIANNFGVIGRHDRDCSIFKGLFACAFDNFSGLHAAGQIFRDARDEEYAAITG